MTERTKKLVRKIVWRISLVIASAFLAALAALFAVVVILPRGFQLGWTYVPISAGLVFLFSFIYLLAQFVRGGWGDD